MSGRQGFLHRSVRGSRSRPVADLEADLKTLNDEFRDKVSSSSVLRERLATLDSFREGVEIASWSSSTIGCETTGSQGGPDTFLFQYASSDGKESGLPYRGSIRDGFDEHEEHRRNYPDEYGDPFGPQGVRFD